MLSRVGVAPMGLESVWGGMFWLLRCSPTGAAFQLKYRHLNAGYFVNKDPDRFELRGISYKMQNRRGCFSSEMQAPECRKEGK